MEMPEFEWNPIKAASNVAKHGVAFDVAVEVFRNPQRREYDATHEDDGEVRWKAVGLIDGLMFTVIYTFRGEVIRVISARRSNVPEVRRYDDGQI